MRFKLFASALSKRRVVSAFLAVSLCVAQLAPGVMANGSDPIGASSANASSPVSDRLLAKNVAAQSIELENAGSVQLAEGYKVEQHLNGHVINKSLSQVMVGTKNVRFQFDGENKVSKNDHRRPYPGRNDARRNPQKHQ
ncbi:hypothetical protein [Paenibacillus sp. MBLB4367]|uniref:hypothetical protein n=1 Tax=Paenibacillus sp. MBLB4367 TaxID=3384767 RepID=UPI003907EBF4